MVFTEIDDTFTMDAQSEIIRLLLASMFGLGLGGFGWFKLRRWLDSYRRRRRAGHALEGEARAEELLRSRGYKVIGRQVPCPWTVQINGETRRFALRADLLVKRRGRRYVAEVKTGSHVASIHHGPTRRQLLEYSHAFGCDGILLVQVDASAVNEIYFPGAPRSSWAASPALVMLLLVSVAAAGVSQLLGT